MSKSRISNLGGIPMMGMTAIECCYAGWICKLSLVPLPTSGIPDLCLTELFLELLRGCCFAAHCLSLWLPVPQPQLFRGLFCSSTGALWLGSLCAFECIRMCFFPSRSYIFLLCNAIRTLLSEDLLHINSIQLVIIFGKRAYKKKIKMR